MRATDKHISKLEEKLGEYILTSTALLGTAGVVETVVNKTTYVGGLYLEVLLPSIIIGGGMYLHSYLKNPKEKN